jgi:hypothetical protein
VADRVSAGEERGMSRSSARVRVVIVAIREVRATIEKHAKASVAEFIAIAFEVIPAELINDDDDHELGMTVISRGKTRGSKTEKKQKKEDKLFRGKSGGDSHREGSLHSERKSAKKDGNRVVATA